MYLHVAIDFLCICGHMSMYILVMYQIQGIRAPLVSHALYQAQCSEIHVRQGAHVHVMHVDRGKDSYHPSVPNPEYLREASNFCSVFILYSLFIQIFVLLTIKYILCHCELLFYFVFSAKSKCCSDWME